MKMIPNGSRVLLVVALTMTGCVKQDARETAVPAESAASAIDPTAFLLDSEPEGAADVITVRETADDDDEVLVAGRIGGSHNPWVEGRAAFSMVDRSLKACSDIEGDECPVPWDYCCETEKLPLATALVKIVDSEGKIVAADARTWLDLRELQTVVVRGKAVRDDAGNLTILATSLFVKP